MIRFKRIMKEACELKEKIELILSDILSAKYDCKVTLRFEPKGGEDDGRADSPD